MALQHRLLFLPPGAERISEHLAAAHHDGRLTFFDASGPIFSCREEDEGALRFAAAMLTEPGLGLAGPSQIARAVRRHRSQVHEYRTRYREGGAVALEVKKRGPRAASKLKGPVLAEAQAGLTAGLSNCKVAAQVGVSEQTIRKGLKDGRLVRQPGLGRQQPVACPPDGIASTPRTRSAADAACAGGVATKREAERALAPTGLVVEAPPQFVAAESVAKAGVLVALPALLGQGLLEVGQRVYGGLKNGYYVAYFTRC